MFRTPRSLKVHAMVDPTGDATRFSGEGNPRICSTLKPRGAGCCAAWWRAVHTIASAIHREASLRRLVLLISFPSVRRPLVEAAPRCEFLFQFTNTPPHAPP